MQATSAVSKKPAPVSAAALPSVLVPAYESGPPDALAAAGPSPSASTVADEIADEFWAEHDRWAAELEVNCGVFAKMKPELLRTRPGQFVLMKGGETFGFFRDSGDAYQSAMERFGRDEVYSVMEISNRPLTLQEWKAAMRQWVRKNYGGSLPITQPTYIQNGVVVGSIDRPYVVQPLSEREQTED